ncbi:hypothetical protein [Streptomyces sp. DG2A-72]
MLLAAEPDPTVAGEARNALRPDVVAKGNGASDADGGRRLPRPGRHPRN